MPRRVASGSTRPAKARAPNVCHGKERVASAYNFAEQLLASQRKFAEDLLRATAPLLQAGPAAAKKDSPAA
jgi:hypothetical protein